MSRKLNKKTSLGLGAVAAAFSMVALVGAPAQAAQPGEETTWHEESAGGEPVYAYRGANQARDNDGNVATVWVNGDGLIRVSYKNGAAKVWPGAVTSIAPEVIYTEWGWRVFHTGNDHHVYYAGFEVASNGALTLGSWQQVPGNVLTNNGVAAAALSGPNQEQWMLAFRGQDGRIYAQYHQRTSSTSRRADAPDQGHFDNPVAVPGATSPNEPDIDFSEQAQEMAVVWTGQDHNLYAATQHYGNPNWAPQGHVGTSNWNASTGPAFAYQGDGHGIEFAATDQQGHIMLSGDATAQVDSSSISRSLVVGETERYTTALRPVLSPTLHNTSILASTENFVEYWKVAASRK
ncbi:hypothetical protein AB0M86_24705 [Streptomyces sp. NPDC051639]|uniref:hypothetical protein n=1 Tax=Streptomyces sp. NPDC051639 TaxID=3155671 RepID=UPI003432B72C